MKTKKNRSSSSSLKSSQKHVGHNTGVFTKEDYTNDNGILTTVWGPAAWLFIHSVSFNYPDNPTVQQKKDYHEFVLSLKNVLPCRYCRDNFALNLKKYPLTQEHLKNRESFSRYIYNMHEHINKNLNKKSKLSYEDVRGIYENFRARCGTKTKTKTKKRKVEKGCTEPLIGKKSKCILKIVPIEHKCKNLQINKKCYTRRITTTASVSAASQ